MPKITIELTQDQLDKILSDDSTPASEWYEPKLGDKYWYLDGDGPWVSTSSNCNVASARQQVFRTKEEAEAADQWRIALTSIRRYIAKNMPFTPDWGDEEQKNKKWSICYDHRRKRVLIDMHSSYFQSLAPFYVGSEEDARKLNADMKPELKILFGVK